MILQDKENPYLLDDWYEVQTSVRTIYDVGGKYSTDMCPFEIYVESDTFGGNNYFDASLGEWLSDINSNVEESTNMEVNNINVTSNTRSDGSLKYDALVYLNQIASKIESEKFNQGYKTFAASPVVHATTILSRTEDTITLQGEINYWYKGGNPDGAIIVNLVMNRNNGDLISYTMG